MELVLKYNQPTLEKLSPSQLFVRNVPQDVLPAMSKDDSHSHKSHVQTDEQAKMAQDMADSFQCSPLLEPGWPQPTRVPNWNCAVQLAPSMRVTSGGVKTQAKIQNHSNAQEGAAAQHMVNQNWVVESDTGPMSVQQDVIKTLLRQSQLMVQREVKIKLQPTNKPATTVVVVHLGMWPHCDSPSCQRTDEVCKHIRFVYRQVLGIPWEQSPHLQPCLTLKEAVKVLAAAGTAPRTTGEYKLTSLAPELNGLTCEAMMLQPSGKWAVTVKLGTLPVTMEVDVWNIVPQPHQHSHGNEASDNGASAEQPRKRAKPDNKNNGEPSPRPRTQSSQASEDTPPTQQGGMGVGTTHAAASQPRRATSAATSRKEHKQRRASAQSGNNKSQPTAQPAPPAQPAAVPSISSNKAIELTVEQMQPGVWHVCRLRRLGVTCKGQYSSHSSPCKGQPKVNVHKNGLVLCIQGHAIHTGNMAGKGKIVPYKTYAYKPIIMYFCTSKDCLPNFRHSVHRDSPNRLHHFCLIHDRPSWFVKPSNQNTLLGPNVQLSQEERAHLQSAFGLSL